MALEKMMLWHFRTTARAHFLYILLLCLPLINSFCFRSSFPTRSCPGNDCKYVTKSSFSARGRQFQNNLPLYESISADESSSSSSTSKKKKRSSKKKKASEKEVARVTNTLPQTSSTDGASNDVAAEVLHTAEAATTTTTNSKDSKRLVWKPIGRVNHKGVPITLLDSPNYVTKGFPYGVVVEETEDDEAEDSLGDDSEIASFDQVFSQQSNDQQEQMELQRQKEEDEIYDKYEYYKPSPQDFDEDGIEKLSSPIFGPYNPIDERAIVTPLESYMVAEHSKQENSTATSSTVFLLDDEEKAFQEEVQQIRKEMKRLDTYIDPHLQLPVPRNVRPWHGTVQEDKIPYEPKDFMNNRFTKPEDKTDFTKLDPYTARKTAVRLALMDNNEWLPAGVSEAYFEKQSKWFRENNVLFGTLRKGECDSTIIGKIQPALKKLGSIVELLSIQDGVFRFHYHGPMKHRRGMQSWTKMMIHECSDVHCTGVVFETGMRVIDERDTLFREYNCYGNPVEKKVYPVDIPGIESYH